MSKIPEYGVPDEESPEMTAADFAKARWRQTGRLVNPEAYARQMLLEMREGLTGETGMTVEKTLRHVEAALAEMNEG